MSQRRPAKSKSVGFIPLFLIVLIIAVIVTSVHFISDMFHTFDNRQYALGLTNDDFVKTDGTRFVLNGQDFKFVGFNLFDAANSYFPDQNKKGYSCPRDNGWWSNIYTESDLDGAMSTMRNQAGATVLRFWAFQRYTNGGTDWSGIDKVIRVAKKNGFKVIPVLEDGAGYCTYPDPAGFAKWKWNSDTWYTDGYKQKMGANALTYVEYVKAIVNRYKDEPTIMAWMMTNEADTSKKVDGHSALVGFANDIGGTIKSIDQHHLVTVGTQSNGSSGASGKDFAEVYGSQYVDFGEIHDWGYWGGDNDPLPGSVDGKTLPDIASSDCQKTYQAKMACSIAFSKSIRKPIIIGESGVAARSDQERQARADKLDKKMNAFFNVGGSGYLVWQWNKVIDSEGFDVQSTTNDPLLEVMKKYSHVQPITEPTLMPTITEVPTVQPTIEVSPTSMSLPSPTTLVPTLRPTAVPTRQTIPTVRPIRTPTPTPVKHANDSVLESELITITPANGQLYSSSGASTGVALKISHNSTALGNISGPIHLLTIRAKGDMCFGPPHINLKLDGRFVFDGNIYSTNFQDYQTNNLDYLNLGNGLHTVEVIYNNDAWVSLCDRNVWIDTISAR